MCKIKHAGPTARYPQSSQWRGTAHQPHFGPNGWYNTARQAHTQDHVRPVTWPGGMRGTPSSALITSYYPNWGLGIPSNSYRGPWGPPFAIKGFPPCFPGVPGDPCKGDWGFLQFLQGSLGTLFWVPPCFTGVPGDSCSGIDGIPPFSTWIPGFGVSRCIFCMHIAAGREEALGSPNFRRGTPSTRLRSLHFPFGSLALACDQVYLL